MVSTGRSQLYSSSWQDFQTGRPLWTVLNINCFCYFVLNKKCPDLFSCIWYYEGYHLRIYNWLIEGVMGWTLTSDKGLTQHQRLELLATSVYNIVIGLSNENKTPRCIVRATSRWRTFFIVIGGETQIYLYEPKSKRQSTVCPLFNNEPNLSKVVRKKLISCFFATVSFSLEDRETGNAPSTLK